MSDASAAAVYAGTLPTRNLAGTSTLIGCGVGGNRSCQGDRYRQTKQRHWNSEHHARRPLAMPWIQYEPINRADRQKIT